jgi:hypothetical protein
LGFSRAADSRIARLPRNFVEVEGEEKGATAEARSGEGCFAAGVSATYYDDVETVLEFYWCLCGHGLRLSGKDSYFILAVMSIVLGLDFWQKYSWGIFNRR